MTLLTSAFLLSLALLLSLLAWLCFFSFRNGERPAAVPGRYGRQSAAEDLQGAARSLLRMTQGIEPSAGLA